LKSPKIKRGFKQIEIENGTLLWEGCWGDDTINLSVAFIKVEGKSAILQEHDHPGQVIIGVISGELKVIELNKLIGVGESVLIPKLKRHTVEFFEDTKIFLVTWNPPDPDVPINGKDKSSINTMLSHVLAFLGV